MMGRKINAVLHRIDGWGDIVIIFLNSANARGKKIQPEVKTELSPEEVRRIFLGHDAWERQTLSVTRRV